MNAASSVEGIKQKNQQIRRKKTLEEEPVGSSVRNNSLNPKKIKKNTSCTWTPQ